MNQVDQNKNKDMIECDLIDVESMDFDDQTWLYTLPEDSGRKLDIVDWCLSCDWPAFEDEEYVKTESEICKLLENLLRHASMPSLPDKHKFDSGTYIKPKKRVHRPSIQNIVEVPSNPPSLTAPAPPLPVASKYLTYNKYSMPLGPVSPMLRLKTFNVDTNTENSSIVKEYALKRKSLVQDDDPQLEDAEATPATDMSERLSPRILSKPINIDLSQPAHNLHNTFNKGLTNLMNERNSLNMYQSGESLMRMSPPSLVSSMVMENSGSFHPDSMDGRKSLLSHKDSGLPMSGRESMDPMMTSITMSILDEKDMSTSFLSQTTHPDNDSFMDSLPPSLVSSVNSSFVISNTSKPKTDKGDINLFSSPTYTHLEQSEKLLSARPRFQLYNNFKRDSGVNKSESYTKSREEGCQIDTTKILNENCDNKDSSKIRNGTDMSETITLHFSNNKFKRTIDAEKENMNNTFEKDDAFFNNNDMHKTVDLGKNSLNVTLDKQELNEIIQARQKLSLARKALPSEPEKPLPNQVQASPTKVIHLPNQTITVPVQSLENASELLSRRRMNANSVDKNDEHTREVPKRNATFKKLTPKCNSLDTTVVYVKPEDTEIIDINSATLNLIDVDRTLQKEEWEKQERAMVGSNESTDTGTFSSSSPPDSVPDSAPTVSDCPKIASTPLMSLKKSTKNELLNIQSTISPIYDVLDEKSYIISKGPAYNAGKYDAHNTTVINSATIKKPVKRDILAPRASPEKKIPNPNIAQRISPTNTGTQGLVVPPVGIPRKSSLPTSKLRQYSSHKELNRIPGPVSALGRLAAGRPMERRSVYASNPVLSPTAAHPPAPMVRRDSYVLVDHRLEEEKDSVKASIPPTPALIRQGTETLRRERPLSQLVAPKDPPTTRPYSVAGASQLRVARPSTAPVPKPAPAADTGRPGTGGEQRGSALPRPSRLPAPRRQLRPPSVYSVAHTADLEHY